MKTLLSLLLTIFVTTLSAQNCNTAISFSEAPTPWDWKFCVSVTAAPISYVAYGQNQVQAPKFLEWHYKTKNGNDTVTWTRGSLNTSLCFSPTTNISCSYYFCNIAKSTYLYVRTLNVAIGPGTPYEGMFNTDIYNLLRGDASKWCMSNSLNINWSENSPNVTVSKGKGKNK